MNNLNKGNRRHLTLSDRTFIEQELIRGNTFRKCIRAYLVPIHNGSGWAAIQTHLNRANDRIVVLHKNVSFRNQS